MNAVALVLCTVALGADARETIPTPRALFEVIDRTYDVGKNARIEISEDGVMLRYSAGDNDESPVDDGRSQLAVDHRDGIYVCISGSYQLKVVACPGCPNFLLAGYVSTNGDITGNVQPNSNIQVLRHCFCVLIDTDRNIVVPLDDPSQRLFLNKEQVDAVQLQCGAIWSDYLHQIEEQSSGAPFYSEYKAFRRQFIQLPPLEVAAKVAFLGAAGNPASYPPKASDWDRVIGMAAAFELSADDRQVSYSGPIEMQKLLSTTIAQSAADYFAKNATSKAIAPTMAGD